MLTGVEGAKKLRNVTGGQGASSHGGFGSTGAKMRLPDKSISRIGRATGHCNRADEELLVHTTSINLRAHVQSLCSVLSALLLHTCASLFCVCCVLSAEGDGLSKSYKSLLRDRAGSPCRTGYFGTYLRSGPAGLLHLGHLSACQVTSCRRLLASRSGPGE